MVLVVNSGPLIALARVGRLDLLPALFGEILVPSEVFSEVTDDPSRIGAEELSRASWMRVQPAPRREVERLSARLGLGEAAAIALALELGAAVALDDRRGRTVARQESLQQTGTVGILIAARRRGLVPALYPLLDQVAASGLHLSDRLYREALESVGELTAPAG